MLIIHYFCIILIVMKLVRYTNGKNDSIYDVLSPVNKSLLILQRFTRADERSYLGKSMAIQTRTMTLSQPFQMSISVKVEINSTLWNRMPIDQQQSLWLKLRGQLYWGCETRSHVQSLCFVSKSTATSTLIIRLSDASDYPSEQSYLQCSVCFLKEPGVDVIDWRGVSQHLETISFDLHPYIPQNISNQQYSILMNVSRMDLLPLIEEFDKIFITNITITNIPTESVSSNSDCKFICGWGPQCLDKISDICNNEVNCVHGEDEDRRLCKAFRNKIVSLEGDFIRTSTVSFIYKRINKKVMSTINHYLVSLLSTVIILLLILLVVCFLYRNHEIMGYLSSRTQQRKSLEPETNIETSCRSCQLKSQLNIINCNPSGRSLTQAEDVTYDVVSEPMTIISSETAVYNRPTDYLNPVVVDPPRQTLTHNRVLSYSKRKEVVATTDWLDLFLHVSNEARHKGLARQPPPNVNNGNGKTFVCGYNFSTSPSTCVFPVMI